MRPLTPLQQHAINAARAELQYESWFVGVCLDYLPTDQELQHDFVGCIEMLIVDTAYHDNPNLFT